MATRREIVEAILFVPAMLGLAALAFGVFAGIIIGGKWLLNAAMWLFSTTLGLPRPLGLTLAVFVTMAVVTAGWTLVTDGWGRRKRR